MYRPVAEIHLDRLVRNYLKIKTQVGDAEMMPVVKANGYGHGAVQVSRILQDQGARFFGVFTIGEALELREHGIEGDIFIFSRMTEDALSPAVEYDLTLNISCRPTSITSSSLSEKLAQVPECTSRWTRA